MHLCVVLMMIIRVFFSSFLQPLWFFSSNSYNFGWSNAQQRRWKSEKDLLIEASLPIFLCVRFQIFGLIDILRAQQPSIRRWRQFRFFSAFALSLSAQSRRPFSLRFISFFRFSNMKSIARKLYAVEKILTEIGGAYAKLLNMTWRFIDKPKVRTQIIFST